MTLQLPPHERARLSDAPDPEVLFEEARRRRHRRWMAGGALSAAAIVAGAVILAAGGGGGGQTGATAHGQPPGPGSGSGHPTAGRLFPGAPATQGYNTGPGATCALAPRSRYLPPWSGCVSTMVADVTGNGRRDLVLTYSRLSHAAIGGPQPRSQAARKAATRYPAEQAMLRIVYPDGRATTTAIEFMTAPLDNSAPRLARAQAADLISVAHVSATPGKQIFVQTGQISSGSSALVYSVHGGRLVSAGVVLGYGGDGGTQAGFQCVAGSPPRLLQHTFQLVQLGPEPMRGLWNATTTTYAWHGPRLVKLAQRTVRRRLQPTGRVGAGCRNGVA